MAAIPKRETTRSVVRVVRAKATTATANAAAANVLVVFIRLGGTIFADVLQRFFKTAVGQYGAGDAFLGMQDAGATGIRARHERYAH